MAEARFDNTPEYDASVARGIARELREEAKAAWRLMHEQRRLAGRLKGGDANDAYNAVRAQQTAAQTERQLRFLLGIRRAGLR